MRPRLTVLRLMVAVAALGIVLGFCVLPLAKRSEYARLQQQMSDRIGSLKPSNPQSVNPSLWDCAAGWTVTAYWNICFSDEHVSREEMYRLRDDLDRKLGGEITPDTLKWIWRRLAQTGPHGKSYVTRFGPRFLECFTPSGSNVETDLLTLPTDPP
jgi:hypothetical protein